MHPITAKLHWFLVLFLLTTGTALCQNLFQFMQAQPEISSIKAIDGNHFFNQCYEIRIRQPLNHRDTTQGFFLQRVFVSDKKADRPVVLITEGYDANYAAQPNFIHELSPMLEANQLCVEHRYFGESVPDPINWEFLTVENAARDHHRIVQLFKKHYQEKWLNTGISKGGQTALAHRSFFPNDVSATVAYVAPLNFGVEDGRHERFLNQVGSDECRDKIRSFQREILVRRAQMLPLLTDYAKQRNYTFPMPMDETLDYIVLEYAFSFWQWGHNCNAIPADTASTEALFNNLIRISSPDYFSYQGSAHFRAFFYQAARELGYYGYDTQSFADLLSLQSTQGYVNQFMLPVGSSTTYSDKTSRQVDQFLKSDARNVVLIYGEVDPWSATAATVRKRGNNHKIVQEGGNHATRIGTLPEQKREKLIRKINKMVR
ncbi:S28 family serine protease [uncultured Sunxiuqinia sp.]|uniref:S28 family serine protease n=1 Tax=uncultured Sunxiuqinia sp. TaxID=1573825 RepID=UPI002622C1EB|nr:S28 family serine protease [uncultured Sunxiuqinia sp.]